VKPVFGETSINAEYGHNRHAIATKLFMPVISTIQFGRPGAER
jgi:hypothetical protein